MKKKELWSKRSWPMSRYSSVTRLNKRGRLLCSFQSRAGPEVIMTVRNVMNDKLYSMGVLVIRQYPQVCLSGGTEGKYYNWS
jgi:hypothetical protein